VGKNAPALFVREGRRALALFGSTSPSYLILASLDECNARLASGYAEALQGMAKRVSALKKELSASGWELYGDEPLKLTVCPKSRGYTGAELAELLSEKGIEAEFSDPDHLVLMLSPMNTEEELSALEKALLSLPPHAPISLLPPRPAEGERAMEPALALLSAGERIPVGESLGRILADFSVGCPPAVPIATVGERIGEEAILAFRYYGVDVITAVEE
jgi:arginine/lysine/ornithine decarboxylase